MSEYFTKAAQDRTEKAIALARKRMDDEGYVYPSPIEKQGSALLDAIDEYRRKESTYIVEFLKAPSGPRPIALDTTKKPKPARVNVNQWGQPYYEE